MLKAKTPSGKPVDPVARFHLGNGARLERLNFLGDLSPRGMKQAHGLMVNYLYKLDDIETNHERFAGQGRSRGGHGGPQAAAARSGRPDDAGGRPG